MAGGAGAVAGGLATVAGSTGAHLSGESAKLSGARDHPGERRPGHTSHVASAPPFFHYTFPQLSPLPSFFLSIFPAQPERTLSPASPLGLAPAPPACSLVPQADARSLASLS